MHITDPIADMLTRIRNANNAKHDTVDIPASNMKKAIAQILLDEGYIKAFQLVDDGTQGVIHVTLKYNNPGKEKVISPPYQTNARTSPPTWAARAALSVMMPLEVDTMATPRPRRTRGSSSAPAYTRRPGLETRRRPEITFSLPGLLYFRVT